MSRGSLKQKSKAPHKSPQSRIYTILLATVASSSIALIPIIFDSFTTPKILAMYVGIFASLVSILYLSSKDLQRLNRLPVWSIFFIVFTAIGIICSTIIEKMPLVRSLFGQFGRGNGLFYFVGCFLILILVACTYQKETELQFVRFIRGISWFFATYAILQKLSIDIAQLGPTFYPVVLTFGNSNFAGGMLAILFTYVITNSLSKKSLKFKDFYLPIILFFTIYLTGAVQGFMIAAFAIIIVIPMRIYSSNKFIQLKKFIYFSWGLSFVSIILGILGYGPLAQIFARTTFQMRIEYWIVALRIMRDNLWFGVGVDRFYDVTPRYMTPGSLEIITVTRMDNAHNWFLQFGASFGLFSLIGFLSLIFLIIISFLSRIKDPEIIFNTQFSTVLTLSAIIIDGLVSIEQPGLGVWLYLFLGKCLGYVATIKINNRLENQLRNSKILEAFVRIGICILSAGILFSTSIISLRIYNDASLRHNIQKSMSLTGTTKNLEKISQFALKLEAEPEYMVQATPILAKAGDGRALLQLSAKFYDYNPNSIQAIEIQARVLSVVDSVQASCPYQVLMVQNSPWLKPYIENYVLCSINGFKDEKLEVNSITILSYFDFTFKEDLMDLTSFQYLMAQAIKANLTRNSGKVALAQQLNTSVAERLAVFKIQEPQRDYTVLDTLTNW